MSVDRVPPGALDHDSVEPPATAEAGDAACWAHLVCPECGSVVSEGHREGCSSVFGSGPEPTGKE